MLPYLYFKSIILFSVNNKEEYFIDWQFADVIYKQKSGRPGKVSENERQNFKFVVEDYQDAVVMPWYRNLDKPQFFYVAEICTNLTPKSDFPDLEYETFETYYKKKYNITIMNHEQPLLDVDHTSARLNLLTPRYVNRKGVTLPTSSEQTKKTKRENLQQKQILIPELCTVHPFPAYLWRKAVCLPCILYRLNSLLLAEQLRLLVADSISVGMKSLPDNFQWPALDFGWTLADILVAQNSAKENKEIKQTSINTYKPKDNLKNGFLNPINTMNFIEDLYEPPDNNDVFTDVNNGMMDFEIDVFDPSKLKIPDDDELLEKELMDINFGMGNSTKSFPVSFGNSDSSDLMNSYPLWQNIPDSNNTEVQPVSVIRYGSPSNFEDSGWDSEWDTEEEESGFLAVNFHGLGYISAPGVINMESLSMDLASCRDDMWDSMDEDSITSDDMDTITFSKSIPAIEASKSNGFKSAKTCEEICEYSWLTCPMKEECSNVVCDDSEIEEELKMSINALKEAKKKEIAYLYHEESETFTPESEDCSEILSAIVQSESSLNCTLLSATEPEQGTDTFHHCEKMVSNNASDEPILAFGELLPNRDHHQLYDNMHRVKFDESPDLTQHPGPSPSIILQALTMSNANDGINLERLETVGDSFLKYAITVYLFCMYPNIHEGKLSYLRSKQISNFNLYKLGKRKGLGELMVASKFEPYDNWLPPNYIVPRGLEEALIESGLPSGCWNLGNLNDLTQMTEDEIRQCIIQRTESNNSEKSNYVLNSTNPYPLVPYNLLTQHSIPDKSIADCVEALIGAYLVSCGSRGALLFMSWLGLRVLPAIKKEDGTFIKEKYGYLTPPPSPILTRDPKSNLKLEKLLAGYSAFEEKIGYSFNDKSCLLQAFTHASYYYNTLTDCYQRLEFLGDAVLDYLITRHLYEDPKKHSPGTLTDLRSALVNNTFFASLAVKYDFHKFFKAISPGLFNVINKFVLLKEHNSGLEDYLVSFF